MGGKTIFFEDYEKTRCLYHVVSIHDLEKVMTEGIKYADKATYLNKYAAFHAYFDKLKPGYVPDWVQRSRGIFGSMNYKASHKWHAHTALLRIKVNEQNCWICNENIANSIYEPFVLQNMASFPAARCFLDTNGKAIVKEYWDTSLSFQDNLARRLDKQVGYDAEVLIFENILPENIECLFIISDHRVMGCNEWESYFNNGKVTYTQC